MQAARNTDFVSVEEYLANELTSPTRREYIAGTVYAMAGASLRHGIIIGNLFAAIHPHLRGKPCRPFVVDVKVRLRLGEDHIYYYPDLMVTCDPRDTDEYFVTFPKVLVEVQSPTTERLDRHEKFMHYAMIESLQEYILVAQDRMEATVFRRANDWRPEVVNQPESKLQIPSLEFTMPLAAIYEDAPPSPR